MIFAVQCFWFCTAAVCAACCMQILRCMMPLRAGWWRIAFLFIACLLSCSMVIFVGDLANLPPTILLFLAAVWVCCEGTGLQRVTIGLMMACTIFSFNCLMDTYGVPAYKGIWYRTLEWVLRMGFWLVFYLLLRRISLPPNYTLAPKYWKLLLLLTITPLGIVLSVVLLQFESYTVFGRDYNALSNQVLLILSCGAMIGLFWVLTTLVRQQQLEQSEQQMRIDQAYYKSLEQQQLTVRQLRHDLANHLQTLASLRDTERDAYLQELIGSPAIQMPMRLCENQVVNAVLQAKQIQMEQAGIRLVRDILVPEGGNLERAELCALIANSLDNAIEACQKLEPSQRAVHLTLKAEKGILGCRMTNPLPAPVQLEHGLPRTSKKDGAQHGFGLRSIRETVLRHGGDFEIQIEAGQFTLFWYLPFETT